MTLHRQAVADFDWWFIIALLQLAAKISVSLTFNMKEKESAGQLIRPKLNKILFTNNKKEFKVFT